MKMYMAIDQYGQTYHGLKHPRKDLCERLCRSHVEKCIRIRRTEQRYFVGMLSAGYGCSCSRFSR